MALPVSSSGMMGELPPFTGLYFLGLQSNCYTWKMVRTVSHTTKMSFCDADRSAFFRWFLQLVAAAVWLGTQVATKGHSTVLNPTRALILRH